MEAINQVMKDITLTEKKNQAFKLLTPFDVEEEICPFCNYRWFDKSFKMYVPGKDEPVHYQAEKCWECVQKDEAKKLAEKVEEERLRRIEEKDQERKQRFYEIFDENSLMNPKLKEATFENYNPTNAELEKAKGITKRYADNFSLKNPVSLLLIGNYGTGKSHLSSAISKELIKKEFTSIFVSTPKLLTKIKATYNKNSLYSEDELLKILSDVDLLVMDDIGAESTKQGDGNQHTWATSKIFEIIDNRIGKHTIFTSNYEPKELQERLGGRNFSRMMESVHVIKMYGDDYRLKDFK